MKKKTVTLLPHAEENPFAQSTGDLMAGLLLVFVLILASTLLRLEDEFEQKVRFAEDYRLLREELYQDLNEEFKMDLPRWSAVLDRDTLSLRFTEPEVLFDQGKDAVKERFSEIINDFFPRYVEILSSPKYKDSIEEIRIEGHTSSEWTGKEDPEKAYFLNMALSQNRTRNVLQSSLATLGDLDLKGWVRSKITANGLSSSQPILRDGEEDKSASRRVEFRVRTNAEEKIAAFLERWKDSMQKENR